MLRVMRIHHLNCGTMCPIGGRLLPSVFPAEIVCHCLLIEGPDGLVLVDAGLGTRDIADPKRLGPTRLLLNVAGDPREPAVEQVQRLGFDPEDVRHVVVTHLDLDHGGGITDFPHAEVHVMVDEYDAGFHPRSSSEKSRYRQVQWKDHEGWRKHRLEDGEAWFGFDAVREIPGLPPEVLLVPLPGHTRGHMGVAVDIGERWLFHVGDAFYDGREMDGEKMTPGLKLFQNLVNEDNALATANRQRLYDLHRERGDEVDVFCAHDPTPFERLRGA